jgi:hypothetical protein
MAGIHWGLPLQVSMPRGKVMNESNERQHMYLRELYALQKPPKRLSDTLKAEHIVRHTKQTWVDGKIQRGRLPSSELETYFQLLWSTRRLSLQLEQNDGQAYPNPSQSRDAELVILVLSLVPAFKDALQSSVEARVGALFYG